MPMEEEHRSLGSITDLMCTLVSHVLVAIGQGSFSFHFALCSGSTLIVRVFLSILLLHFDCTSLLQNITYNLAGNKNQFVAVVACPSISQ